MSKREITLAGLRSEFDAQQAKGSHAATVFGVALFLLVAYDSYAGAAGLPGPTGLLFSSLGLHNYHAIFVLTVILQAGLLVWGFTQLLKSKWQTGTAHQFWTVLKHGWSLGMMHRRNGRSPFLGQSRVFWVTGGLLVLLVLGCSYMTWWMTDKLFLPLVAVSLAILVGFVLGLDLAILFFVARRDLFVVSGITAAALLIAAGAIYGPEHLLASHSWGAKSIPDFEYWQALLFALIVLGSAALLLERQQTSIVFVLKENRGSLPPGVTPVPFFADPFGRAVHMMFAFSGVNAIGLYGTLGASDLRVIDLDDSQQSLTLNGHSLTIWNLTSLEATAQQSTTVNDSGNCFQVTAQLQLFPTAEALRRIAGTPLSPEVVHFANDTLFNNAHLQSFLHQVAHDVFERSVSSMSDDIRRIKASAESVSSDFHLESTGSFYMDGQTPESLRHDTLRGIQSNMYGRRYLEEIKALRTRFNSCEERARIALQRSQSTWMSAVQDHFQTRIQSESRPGADHQISPLLQALGLTLRFGSLVLRGAAAECGPLLLATEKDIVTQNDLREAALRESTRHKEDQNQEVVKTMFERQPVSYGNAMKFLERIGAVKPEDNKASSKDLPREIPEKLN